MLSNLFEASFYNKKEKKKERGKQTTKVQKNYVKVKLCRLCERTVGVSISCDKQFKAILLGFNCFSSLFCVKEIY